MKVVAISAGLSQPSSTHLLATRLAAATGADEVEHVELRLLAHDLVNAMLTRVHSPALQQALDHVVSSDALVVVSPVFNASFAGLFKLFFDVLHEGALLDKPVLLGATGGTPRHSLAIDQAMLPVFFYLKAAVVPTSVFAATEDWGDARSGLTRRIDKAGQQLAAMVRQRAGAPLAGQPGGRGDLPAANEAIGQAAGRGVTAQSGDAPPAGPVASVGALRLEQSFEEMLHDI